MPSVFCILYALLDFETQANQMMCDKRSDLIFRNILVDVGPRFSDTLSQFGRLAETYRNRH